MADMTVWRALALATTRAWRLDDELGYTGDTVRGFVTAAAVIELLSEALRVMGYEPQAEEPTEVREEEGR